LGRLVDQGIQGHTKGSGTLWEAAPRVTCPRAPRARSDTTEKNHFRNDWRGLTREITQKAVQHKTRKRPDRFEVAIGTRESPAKVFTKGEILKKRAEGKR